MLWPAPICSLGDEELRSQARILAGAVQRQYRCRKRKRGLAIKAPPGDGLSHYCTGAPETVPSMRRGTNEALGRAGEMSARELP